MFNSIKSEGLAGIYKRKAAGDSVDSKEVKKHKSDVFRLYQILSPALRVQLPEVVASDMRRFLDVISEEPGLSLKPFGLAGLGVADVVRTLRQVYELSGQEDSITP